MNNTPNPQKSLFVDIKYYSLIFCLCCIYGIVTYGIFNWFIGGKLNPTGLMMQSFLVGIPLAIGSTISILQKKPEIYTLRRHIASFLRCLVMGVIIILVVSIVALAALGEGAICVFMALPFLIGFLIIGIALPILLGSLLGNELVKTHQKKFKKYVSIIALAPLIWGGIEQHTQPQDTFHTFEKQIIIEAQTQDIWPLLLNPQNIKPSELSDGIAYKIGAPYPVSASTPLPKIGQMRHSVWQKGITFDEEITAIKENEHIAWKYHFHENSFPKGSLDDHIVIGGTYFDLTKTSYTLEPIENGTVLTMSVSYRISTNFNWYAELWGDLLIGDTAETLLEFYKNRSEQNL